MIRSLFILYTSLMTWAAAPAWAKMTIDECIASANARASLTLSSQQRRTLCENNPQAVVDCTLNSVLTQSISKNYEKALKDCRRDFIRYSNVL